MKVLFKVWIRYFLFWRGLPTIGNLEDADVAIVQAFGRNRYQDEELGLIYKIRQLKGSDLEALKYLWSEDFKPGLPNLSLAEESKKLLKNHDLPLILQWEVAMALGIKFYQENQEKIFCIWPPINSKGFNTLEVKKASLEIMEEKNLSRPIEIAHKRQITRAFLIVNKIMTSKGIKALPIVIKQETDGFDSDSVQEWTTNGRLWYFKEFLVRIHHLLCRWIW